MAMRHMVDGAVDILQDEKAPLRELGELLHESWQLKRELADSVSNSQIDEIYNAAREAGAVGGKLLGAGGGGFMVFFVEEAARDRVREAAEEAYPRTQTIQHRQRRQQDRAVSPQRSCRTHARSRYLP